MNSMPIYTIFDGVNGEGNTTILGDNTKVDFVKSFKIDQTMEKCM